MSLDDNRCVWNIYDGLSVTMLALPCLTGLGDASAVCVLTSINCAFCLGLSASTNVCISNRMFDAMPSWRRTQCDSGLFLMRAALL